MSATTPTTFIDIYTDALQRVRESTTGTTVVDIMSRYVNQGLHDLHLQQNWWWAERRAVLQTSAQYTTGTVATSTSARTTVTGTSTLWTTATGYGSRNNANAGDKIVFAGTEDVYSIASVGGAGTITLNEQWVGATALTASTYRIYTDEYALASDFWRLVDHRMFTLAIPLPVISRQDFYAKYVRNNQPSQPRVSTIIDLAQSASTARQPRLVMHPPPDAVYNLPYRYITTNLAVSSAGVAQTQLSATTDEPIIPLRYRHLLVFYAIAEWYRDRKDDGRASAARQAYEDLMRRAANDSNPERDHPRIVPRTWRYTAGVAGRYPGGSPSSRRFSTGTAFDEMRD